MSDALDTLAQLEALLFFYGEPVSFKKIGGALKVREKKVGELVGELQKQLQDDAGRGLHLLVRDETVQITTKPVLGDMFKELAGRELAEELTPAALETLSLVAYLGPLSRPEVDYVRGVNSSFTMRSLMMRGLLDRRKGSRKGILYEYVVSSDFLRHVGFDTTDALPEYEKYHGLLERLRAQNEGDPSTHSARSG
jgi:segregation and condensation protein B